MVNDSRSPILKFEEKKKHYISHDEKRTDCARQLQHITNQTVKQILHAVDNNILMNLPIMQEDIGMAEDIYGSSVTHFQGKTGRHKIQHLKPIMVTNVPKVILDRYRKFTLLCELMHINGIGFLNTVYR